MEEKIGVINPYALGEQIAGRPINWNSLADPAATLAQILNVPEAELFDLQHPILNPRIKVTAQGKVEELSEADAAKRLTTYFTQRHATPLAATPAGPQVSAAARKGVDKLFHVASLASHGAATPWNPAEKEWIDMGDYFEDASEANDPVQGALGDCYFIAALASVAWARPYAIANVIRPSAWGDDDAPIHQVTFYKNGGGNGEDVEVSERVPVLRNGRRWAYARSRDGGEIWPAVMEKAYAKWRTGNTTDCPPYPPIEGGDPALATAVLIRGRVTRKQNRSATGTDLWNFVRAHSLDRKTFNPMTAWTYASAPAGLDYGAANVVANHAYSVLGWEYVSGQRYVVLRNPWGTHHATLDTRAGTWRPTIGRNTPRACISLNTDGIFSMKADTFQKYFACTAVAV